MWYVIGLIWIALIAAIIWQYRSRRAQREIVRAQQLDALLTDIKSLGAGAAPALEPATAVSARAAVAPAAREYTRKARLLGQPGAFLYFLFRTGLPDHEIFANVPLADAVEIDGSLQGYDREQKARRLTELKLELVVCNRQLEVVAAVVFTRNEPQEPAALQRVAFIGECLRTAGVRLVRIDRRALPHHRQVRELVYGPPGGE